MLAYIIVGILILIIVILLALHLYYKIYGEENNIPQPQIAFDKDSNSNNNTNNTNNTPRATTPRNVKFVTNNIIAYHIGHDKLQQITSTPDNIIYRKLLIDNNEQIWLHDINSGLWSNRTGKWELRLTNTRGFGVKNKLYQLMDIQYSNNQWLLLYSTPDHSILCSLDGTIYKNTVTSLNQDMFIISLHPCDNGWLVTARVDGRTKLWWKSSKFDKFTEPIVNVLPDNHCQLTMMNDKPYVSYFDYHGQNQLSPTAVNLLDIERQYEVKNIGQFNINSRVHDSIFDQDRLFVLYTQDLKLKLTLFVIDSDLKIQETIDLPIGQCTADSRLLLYRNSLMIVNNKL